MKLNRKKNLNINRFDENLKEEEESLSRIK